MCRTGLTVVSNNFQRALNQSATLLAQKKFQDFDAHVSNMSLEVARGSWLDKAEGVSGLCFHFVCLAAVIELQRQTLLVDRSLQCEVSLS